ncbi:MAG: MFS domain-containing histidine kinase [Syntrophomonas sp.]|nr:MFS domain-containing histidine kinase [Syntrophomonas sp.]
MDIKWRKYSHSMTAKILAFIIAILCFSGVITLFINIVFQYKTDLDIAFEESYYLGNNYINDSSNIIQNLTAITGKYKSEEHILNGGSLSEDELVAKENRLFEDYRDNSKNYNPNLTTSENYDLFKKNYADRIAKQRDSLINEDLNEYRRTLQKLGQYQGLQYYAQSGNNTFTNIPNPAKEYFSSFPSYMIFDGSEQKVFPEEIRENSHFYWITSNIEEFGQQDLIYIAFSEEFINPRMAEWQENKIYVANSLYQMVGLSTVLIGAFLYLLFVIGRKPEDIEGVYLNSSVDRIYNDVNLGMCLGLITFWIIIVGNFKIYPLIFPITLLIASFGLILVLSLIKHIKNRTFLKHTLTYAILYRLFAFVQDVYNSGNVAVKVVLLVIGYPIIVTLTFFMFPVILGIAAWLALKKAKAFNAIKEGVKKVKEGDIHHTIDLPGNSELSRLASDINSITDGLNKAVQNEIKSERLKSELITNVSHDIRTPLTSIITYIDLLKIENDPAKTAEYIDVIDQKAQRLKILTEDLFAAAKATSGNIPVNLDKIDIVSLLNQGLGEFDDKIRERGLEFKFSHPQDKIFIKADGKLLWRAIENLLLNIYKYALTNSRVYIDIIDGSGMELIIKNISAYELNISADELMERFVRGDESRSSQGSGLGLSIAKSLIEAQNGTFHIEIDGDLFKVVIRMPMHD